MTTAFVFPGQGSQAVGMGRELVEHAALAREMFAQAADVLGYDLAGLCAEGPKEKLNRTLYTQPALYTMGCVLATLAREQGLTPAVVAGHSVGEYAALQTAGVFSFTQGLAIIADRAKLMDEAGGGAMLAVVGMDQATVEDVVHGLPGNEAQVGLYNSPKQLVVSGSEAAVAEAEAKLKEAGGKKLVRLQVSGAFHCEQMRPVRDRFAQRLAAETFNAPEVPYLSNLTGDVLDDPEAIREALADLLVSPVRWLQSVQRLAGLGVEHCVELGPGRVLKGLIGQTSKDIACTNVGTWEQLQALQ